MLVTVFKWRSFVVGTRTLLQIMNVVDLRNGEKIVEHLFAS